MNSRERRKLAAKEHNERRDLIVRYYNLLARLRARLPRVVVNKLINPSNSQIKMQIAELERVLITHTK